MCTECIEVDKKIVRYKNLSRSVTDKATLEAMAVMIEQHEAEKRALHPEPSSFGTPST